MVRTHLEQLRVHQRQLDYLPQLPDLLAQPTDSSKRYRSRILQRHAVHLMYPISLVDRQGIGQNVPSDRLRAGGYA